MVGGVQQGDHAVHFLVFELHERAGREDGLIPDLAVHALGRGDDHVFERGDHGAELVAGGREVHGVQHGQFGVASGVREFRDAPLNRNRGVQVGHAERDGAAQFRVGGVGQHGVNLAHKKSMPTLAG